jgi:hypothetical protein
LSRDLAEKADSEISRNPSPGLEVGEKKPSALGGRQNHAAAVHMDNKEMLVMR